MTTFEDGPAKGQILMLRRAARFLRVVESKGKWDALDQPTDVPRPDEKIYAYQIVGEVGHCHINRGGGRGGFYPIVNYLFVSNQPTDEEMRTTEGWRKWCERRNGK